jgi:hypothetical protein
MVVPVLGLQDTVLALPHATDDRGWKAGPRHRLTIGGGHKKRIGGLRKSALGEDVDIIREARAAFLPRVVHASNVCASLPDEG